MTIVDDNWLYVSETDNWQILFENDKWQIVRENNDNLLAGVIVDYCW